MAHDDAESKLTDIADHFQTTELEWIADSRILIPMDQPESLASHLHVFLAEHIPTKNPSISELSCSSRHDRTTHVSTGADYP